MFLPVFPGRGFRSRSPLPYITLSPFPLALSLFSAIPRVETLRNESLDSAVGKAMTVPVGKYRLLDSFAVEFGYLPNGDDVELPTQI